MDPERQAAPVPPDDPEAALRALGIVLTEPELAELRAGAAVLRRLLDRLRR